MISKQLPIYLCLSICSLQAYSQSTTPELSHYEPQKFILLKNDMLTQQNLYVPTKVYLNKKKLPFFCDLELKLEAAAKMPVKFRLGEVQQVERLEGKH